MNCGVRLGGVGPGGFSGSWPATRSHKNWRLKDAKVESGSSTTNGSTTSGGPVEEPSTSGRKEITQGDVEHVAAAIHMCQKFQVPVAAVASWVLKDYVDLFLNREKRREKKVLKNKIAIGELQKMGLATGADVQKVGVAVEKVGVVVEELRGGIKKLTESVEKLDIRMGKLEKGTRRKF